MIDNILRLVQPKHFKDELQNWYNGPSGKKQVLWSPPVLNPKVTSKWGNRYLYGKKQFHTGTDYTGANKYVYAPCDCFITRVVPHDPEYPTRNDKIKVPEGRAWTPKIELTAIHDTTLKFVFMHGSFDLVVGQMVSSGSRVMLVGNYGNSTGAHVHAGVKIFKWGTWRWTDPHKFFKKNIPGFGI